MSKKSGYIWIVFLILLVLVVDAYYQVQSSVVPVWQAEWFLWRVLALIIVMAGIILYYYLEAKKKRKKDLEEFKSSVIEAQENEWRMVAGELHDGIGQNLSAINIFLQQNIKSGSADTDNLRQASELVVETIDEVRRISQKLYPKQIERLGLTISLVAMSERLSAATGIRFITNIDNLDNTLSKENEVQYFRIIQEILNNTIKHSKANVVKIDIKRSVMFIVTEIEDNGIGFEVTPSSRLGFGLINIEERIRMIKGVYEFKSEHEKGTKFKITIPIK